MKRGWLAAVWLGLSVVALAEPIAVKKTQGTSRGFVTVRSEEGKLLAHGDLVEVVHGSRIDSTLTYRFLDGSVDQEQTIFTQSGTFQLVSDHHVQKGPFFKEAVDLRVDANGTVTTRTTDKDGQPKVETHHEDLPNDLANGFLCTLLLSVPETAAFDVHVLAASGKGRMVTVHVAPEGHGTFLVNGESRSAAIFRLKIDLHGVAGVIAPIIGKAPQDQLVWILEGPAPAFVRQVGQLTADGPMLSVELSATSFHHGPPAVK